LKGDDVMPLYVYQVIEADGSDGEVFEVLQRISEAPLTVHPDNGP
jgi:predicted nucleic acid-binding Zn ribbon protein